MDSAASKTTAQELHLGVTLCEILSWTPVLGQFFSADPFKNGCIKRLKMFLYAKYFLTW